jgi:hypothetical protein
LAGIGTAESFAAALGEKGGATKLKAITKDIYKADNYTSHMAPRADKSAAKAHQSGRLAHLEMGQQLSRLDLYLIQRQLRCHSAPPVVRTGRHKLSRLCKVGTRFSLRLA